MTRRVSSRVDSSDRAARGCAPAHGLHTLSVMRLACLTALFAIAAAGCRSKPERPPPTPEPPVGNVTEDDPDGVRRTVFTPLGVINFDDPREGALPEHPFSGYEFFGQADVEVTVEARMRDCDNGLLALYGAQDSGGLWGMALVHAVGDRGLTVEHTLDADGMYFILLRCLSADNAEYSVELKCANCAEPSPCEQVEPCDLYCEDGFEYDEFECRACACVEVEPPPSCDDVECAAGEVCEDGECREDPRACADRCANEVTPVCGNDGVTYPNACLADCAGANHSAGACPTECGADAPCPDDQPCVRGRCCDCPDESRPVCGADGEDYRNACILECAGVEPRHDGPCVDRPCDDASDCPDNWRCQPARVRGNDCRDPDSDACIRECQPPARMQPCSADDRECDDPRTACYVPGDASRGVCLFSCDLDAPQCPQGAACAQVPGGPDRGGLCLRACDPDADRGCEPSQACLEDPHGTHVCVPGPPDCDRACDDAPDHPVCVEGRDYESPCHARCAGHPRWMEGRCGDERECHEACADEELLLVCGDGVVFSSPCEARCQNAEVERYPGRCLRDVDLDCRVDEDCEPTGCEGSVCAARPTRACPDYSPLAACFTEGACGCVNQRCAWQPDEHTRECVTAQAP